MLVSLAYSVDRSSFGSIDLSNATGLKDLSLGWDCDPQWVALTLRTITSDQRNLRRISLQTKWERHYWDIASEDPSDFEIGESSRQGWLELDKALIQLSESQSICPQIVFRVPTELLRGKTAGFWVESLLPEAMARGIIILTEQSDE